MIVYSGNKAPFQKDAINGVLARRIDETFRSFGMPKESYAEYKSWENSLPQMGLVLSDPRIDNEVQVALEYQIPLTSKRVDFMVGRSDGIPVEKTIFSLEERNERLLKILKLSG